MLALIRVVNIIREYAFEIIFFLGGKPLISVDMTENSFQRIGTDMFMLKTGDYFFIFFTKMFSHNPSPLTK
jgi:hypothetical protein